MTTWQTFFSWPTGGIWSNLLASVIWGSLAFAWAHRKIKNLHKRLDYQDQQTVLLHHKVKKIHKHLGIK